MLSLFVCAWRRTFLTGASPEHLRGAGRALTALFLSSIIEKQDKSLMTERLEKTNEKREHEKTAPVVFDAGDVSDDGRSMENRGLRSQYCINEPSEIFLQRVQKGSQAASQKIFRPYAG